MGELGKTVTIVGGGLAGLTLGLGLRQRGVPAVVWEAGHYPRHRVCGEFISGHGQEVIRRLGLLPVMLSAGATQVRHAAFFFQKTQAPTHELTPPALSISRYRLDALLAERFVEAGGELHTGAEWQGEAAAQGVVDATGRRLTPAENGWRWFGLKAHAHGVHLAADLEMHLRRDGYVGISRLDEDCVNVCGLFRQKVGAGKEQKSWRETLQGPAGTGLAQRLQQARFEEGSFRAVAGLGLSVHRAGTRAECCLGDALTMIPPVTGNGMSMAFEAAELAIEPLRAWSQGELSWDSARRLVAQACDQRFTSRLAWARLLQWLMFSPFLLGRAGAITLHSNLVWRLFFSHTR